MGNTLLFMVGVLWFEKSSKLRTKTLPTRRGDVLGALHLFITQLIIFQ